MRRNKNKSGRAASDAPRSLTLPEARGGGEDETPEVQAAHGGANTKIDITFPVEGILDCQACRAEGRVSSFLEAKDMVKHAETTHPRCQLNFTCRGCAREWPGLNNVRSHWPRCRGEVAQELGDFQCESCDRRFGTQRSLSQHEVKAHPTQRNLARMQSQQPKPPSIREGKEWAKEEVELLEQLEGRFAGQRHINVLMEPYFPGKTNKQISSKRSDLVRRRRRREEVVEREQHPIEPIPEQPIPDVTSLHDIYGPAEGAIEDTDDDRAWRICLAASAAKQQGKIPEKFHEIGCRLETIGRKLATEPDEGESTHADLEFIIDTITSMVAKDQTRSKGGDHRTQRKREKTNRTARRKRNYAITQKLARHDMRKLANIVVENRLEQLEEERVPSKAPVEALYQPLWGVRDETSFPESWERKVNTKSTVVLIPPIQYEAVLKRHRALKADTTTGNDGVRKEDLSSGALVLLTMVYNLVLAAKYFPISWRTNRTTLLPKTGKDPEQVANWRPITISSVISRLFSGLVDSSLRQNIRFNYRQKGFTSESGTFNNVALLQQTLHNAKRGTGRYVRFWTYPKRSTRSRTER